MAQGLEGAEAGEEGSDEGVVDECVGVSNLGEGEDGGMYDAVVGASGDVLIDQEAILGGVGFEEQGIP